MHLRAGRSSQPRRQNAAMSSTGMLLATSRADAATILGWTEVNFGMTLGNSEQNATPASTSALLCVCVICVIREREMQRLFDQPRHGETFQDASLHSALCLEDLMRSWARTSDTSGEESLTGSVCRTV